MLIYNYKKEFLGIDAKDLEILGLESLAALRALTADFADLFVKAPGYIHNFKHVHWIDFIEYADADESMRVRIEIGSNSFEATLSLEPIFLSDNPKEAGYIVHLNNLHALHGAAAFEDEDDKPLELPDESELAHKPETTQRPLVMQELSTNEAAQVEPQQEEQAEQNSGQKEESLQPTTPTEPQEDELHLELVDDNAIDRTVLAPQKTEELWDNGYHYDPEVASKALGLSLDLIVEFLQDFILQANDFKGPIYEAIASGDVVRVKELAHKLKGVASNLRIDDAFEVLSIISATDDMAVIHENIDIFYKIITKMMLQEEQNGAMDAPLDDILDDLYAEDIIVTEPKGSSDASQNVFDPAVGASKMGIDQESYQELFDAYLEEGVAIVSLLKAAHKQADTKRIETEALRLKSMSEDLFFFAPLEPIAEILQSSDAAREEAIQRLEATLTSVART